MEMRVESTRDESSWSCASAITRLVEFIHRSARRSEALQHNESFNPTRTHGLCYHSRSLLAG
jgi:hypothetical protein